MNPQKIKQKVRELFDKQSRNQADLQELNNWYQSIDAQAERPENEDQRKAESWERIMEEIRSPVDATPTRKKFFIGPWIWKAAILLIFCGAGIGLFRGLPESSEPIKLEAGKYTNAIGKVSVFSLPDGSKVWLSTGSTLEYAEDFPQNRQVKLTGEAFFEVARNREFPFQISTGSVTTEVLGTSFNLRSYEATGVELSVYSGRVKFLDQKSAADSVVLLKGEKVSWTADGGISETELFDFGQLPGWRQGKIIFENADLGMIKSTLERWYNVTITIEGQGKSCHYSGEFTQASLEQILETLSYTLNQTYKIKDAHVTIHANPCE